MREFTQECRLAPRAAKAGNAEQSPCFSRAPIVCHREQVQQTFDPPPQQILAVMMAPVMVMPMMMMPVVVTDVKGRHSESLAILTSRSGNSLI